MCRFWRVSCGLVWMRRMSDLARWLPFYRQRPNERLWLFCFPHAGGGASLYRGWQEVLPPEVGVCAVQWPGRETRIEERPFTSLDELIEAWLDVFTPWLKRPFAFFGHSLGALIAFELARSIRRKTGHTPALFIASGFRAPQLPSSLPRICHLPDAAFLHELSHLGSLPQAVWDTPELIELLLPALRADFTIYEQYQYQPSSELPLPCPVYAWGGLGDKLVSFEELDGWREQAWDAFAVRLFPGGHFYLQESRSYILPALAHLLAECVAQFI